MKKFKKPLILSSFLIFLLVVLIIFPLPKNIATALLNITLNNFLPNSEVKAKEPKLFIFSRFEAKQLRILTDKERLAEFHSINFTYSPLFVFSGYGRINVTSGDFAISQTTGVNKFLGFLSNVLDLDLEEKLTFKNLLLKADVKKRKITIDVLEANGDDFKIKAQGYLIGKEKIDFDVDIFLSEDITKDMSEEAKNFLLEERKSNFSKIGIKICGQPQRPVYRIKVGFLKLDVD